MTRRSVVRTAGSFATRRYHVSGSAQDRRVDFRFVSREPECAITHAKRVSTSARLPRQRRERPLT